MSVTVTTRTDVSGPLRALEQVRRTLPSGRSPELQRGLRQAGEQVLAVARGRFGSQGDGEWADDAEATKQQKRRKGQSTKVGVASGELLTSLKPGGPGNVLEVKGGTVKAGTAVPHAKFFDADRPIFPELDARELAAVTDPIARAAQTTIRQAFTIGGQ